MSVPPRTELPDGVEAVSIPLGAAHVAALTAGPADGPAVVLVPGFTGSKEDFLPILAPMARAGLQALAYDQRGQFESPGHGGRYDLAGFGDDLAGVMSGRGRPVHLVGHSFGGLVCRETLLRDPAAVASITLVASGPGALPPERHALLETLLELLPQVSLQQIWDTKEELDRQAGIPPQPADVTAFLARRWVANDPASMAGIARALLSAPDRTAELASALGRERPGLVLYGPADDTAWRVSDIVAMAERLGVPAVPVPDSAHSPAVENPEATAGALAAFIRNQDV